MPTPEDDGRHTPGPDALPLWNESYWFPFYDPRAEIGVVLRAGVVPNQGAANLFLFFIHRGAVVHSVVDMQAPLPGTEPRRLAVGDFVMEWERPLERFRLRYAHGAHAMDVAWEGYSPAYLYPRPPDTSTDLIPGHVEQGGRVTGTVTLAGTPHRIDCLGHRDHTWGGERDWAKFHSWDYLSGEIDASFWFHAVRVAFAPGADIFVGCLWDGRELHALSDIAVDVTTTDGGTRQTGVDVRFTDERGRAHRVVGEEVLAVAPVQYGRTWLRDGFTRYRYGERIGYGILEHGYLEPR
jgi:hypothetical protein